MTSRLVPFWLEKTAQTLQEHNITDFWREARLLTAHALQTSYEQVLLGELPSHEPEALAPLLKRRLEGEPLSKIRGEREFWGLPFYVTQDTLDPRPDTETLIEAVLEQFPDRQKPYRILDLGTGTGCIIIALLKEYPNAIGVGVDCSENALSVAQRNGQRHDLDHRLSWAISDWGQGLEDQFDIIVSNPPYIANHEPLEKNVLNHDPHLALFGGKDGLDAYRRIFFSIPPLCHMHTFVFLEIGYQQSISVSKLIQDTFHKPVFFKKDLSKIDRIAFFAY